MSDGKQFSKTDEELRKELTPEEYRVLREKGTEAAFTGKYYDSKEKGMYRCRVCGQELFSSDAKFDSATGWPSFTDPIHPHTNNGVGVNLANVELKEDRSHGMVRTEVTCKRCGSHLGHVFDDGPQEKGGKRYCINSVCLMLEKDGETPPHSKS